MVSVSAFNHWARWKHRKSMTPGSRVARTIIFACTTEGRRAACVPRPAPPDQARSRLLWNDKRPFVRLSAHNCMAG